MIKLLYNTPIDIREPLFINQTANHILRGILLQLKTLVGQAGFEKTMVVKM